MLPSPKSIELFIGFVFPHLPGEHGSLQVYRCVPGPDFADDVFEL